MARTHPRVSASINSQIDGVSGESISFSTASKASESERGNAITASLARGRGTSFNHASATTPNVPSEPMKRSLRFGPTENFLSGLPHSSLRPSAEKP